jgi:WD40 repeat protein
MKNIYIFFFILPFICPVNKATAQDFVDYKTVSSGSSGITAVKYNGTGTAFASGNAAGLILVRDTTISKNNGITHILRVHTSEITHLDFHPSGNYLVSTCTKGELKVWNLSSEKIIFETGRDNKKDSTSFYTFAYFTADNQALIYGGTDGKMYITRPFVKPAPPSSVIITEPKGINCADYAQNGNLMIIGTQGTVKVIDFMSKKVKKQISPCGSGQVADVKFNANDTQMGCLCNDGNLAIFDVQTGNRISSQKVTNSGAATEIAFSPDGKYLVTGDADRIPKVWDLSDMAQPMSKLIGHQNAIRCVDFAPNSKFILSGGNDFMIKMWQWRKLNEEEEKEKEEEPIVALPPPIVTVEPPKPPVVEPPKPQATVVVNKPKETPKPTPAAPKKEPIKPLPEIPLKPKPKPSVTPKAEVVQIEEEPPYTPPANFTLENERLRFNNKGLPDSIADRRVRPGRRQMLRSNQVTIKIWDSEYQDNDTISLYLNGQWLLKEYMLHNKKKTIKATLDPTGDNFFILYAHNEGTRPTNTAAVVIYDGVMEYRLALSSNFRNSDMINLRVMGSTLPKEE